MERRFCLQKPELFPDYWKLNGNILFELFLTDLDENMTSAGYERQQNDNSETRLSDKLKIIQFRARGISHAKRKYKSRGQYKSGKEESAFCVTSKSQILEQRHCFSLFKTRQHLHLLKSLRTAEWIDNFWAMHSIGFYFIYSVASILHLEGNMVSLCRFAWINIAILTVYKQFFWYLNFANHRTKESFVSTANKPLVGTLMTIGDVTVSIAIPCHIRAKLNI